MHDKKTFGYYEPNVFLACSGILSYLGFVIEPLFCPAQRLILPRRKANRLFEAADEIGVIVEAG